MLRPLRGRRGSWLLTARSAAWHSHSCLYPLLHLSARSRSWRMMPWPLRWQMLQLQLLVVGALMVLDRHSLALMQQLRRLPNRVAPPLALRLLPLLVSLRLYRIASLSVATQTRRWQRLPA